MWVYKHDYKYAGTEDVHEDGHVKKKHKYNEGYAVGFVDVPTFTMVEWFPSADTAGKRCHYLNGGRYFVGGGELY